MIIGGESGEVSGKTVESWKECLPEIVDGYKAEDIWNMDETGCFWKALPNKRLAQKGKSCKGGEKSKQQITVAFFVNGVGEKEYKPIVIWKSEKPHCFKRVDKTQLPVQYHSQPKAWITASIMHSVLTKLNNKMRAQSCSILLIMDNAGCHPEDLAEKYSNIRVIFLPANCTSIQPLDLGTIKNFKVHYHERLLYHVLTKIDTCSTAHDIIKLVTILDAIKMGRSIAWEKVSPETIQKCFRKAGILSTNLEVVSRFIENEEDPFADLEDHNEDTNLDEDLNAVELQYLMDQLQTEDPCSVEEFIQAYTELPAC